MEMKEKMELISMNEKQSSVMIRQKDIKIEDQLEAVKSRISKNTRLRAEVSEMSILMESTTAGLLRGSVHKMKQSWVKRRSGL